MNPQLAYAAHRSHLEDVARSAGRRARTRPDRFADEHEVTIRVAGPADAPTLALLAALDCSPVPHGHVLLGSVDGEVRAGLRVADGAAVADPFAPTVEVVELLRERGDRLRAPRVEPRHRFGALRRLARRPA